MRNMFLAMGAGLFLLAACAADTGTDDVAASAADQAETETAYDRLVFTHATLIDAVHDGPRENQTVIIENGRISAILDQADFESLDGDEVIDLSGRYLVPGFFDAHVHLFTEAPRDLAEDMLSFYVHRGITTVRDMAGDARYQGDFRRVSQTGDIPLPDYHYSALMAGPSFFTDPRTHGAARGETPGGVPWMQAITDDTDIEMAVARAVGTGATGIKIYANLPGTIVEAIAAEALVQDMRVWTHAAVAPSLPANSATAGVNSVSHVCMLVSHISPNRPQAYPARPDEDFSAFGDDMSGYADLFARMVENDVAIDATLFIYERARREREANPDNPPRIRCPIEYAGMITRAARDAGVRIMTGTDGMSPPGSDYPALFTEFDLLADHAGFTPFEVLEAATISNAIVMGIEDETGSIEAGKRADLVVLTDDPLADVSNLRSLEMTVRSGRVYRREDYVPVALAEGETQ